MSTDAADMAALTELASELAKRQADWNEALDTVWMLLASMLIFFMHAGFSMLETGSVRLKNTQNILAKNLIVVTLGFLCWYVVGYPLALGATENPGRFAGLTHFAMDGFLDSKSSFRVWLFQGTFCATGATIVSGAIAERVQLKGFITFTILFTSIIYPVVVYWGWSGEGIFWKISDGDKAATGGPSLIDFAGSGIVHMTGGIAAFVGAAIVGSRNGRWDPATIDEFDGHNVPFCVLGTFFLWFGWYGFNAGSTGSMHDMGTANTAGIVAVNTTLAPAIAGLVVFFLRAKIVEPNLLDVSGFCNGILAGLVSITAGCAAVKHWEAIVIGAIGAVVYEGASLTMRKYKIDDVVDAFAVHGACGMWGVLSLGFFGDPEVGGNGMLYSASSGFQFGTQVFAVFMIILWVASWSAVIFYSLKVMGFLRLSDEFQEKGADAMEHSPRKAYSDQAAVAIGAGKDII